MSDKRKKKNIKFEVICNSCVICHRRTLNNNPFYICTECKKKLKADKEIKEYIDKYKEEKNNCNTCIHYKPNNPYCECCFDLDKYENEVKNAYRT